jgi:hypothetical protein
MARSGRRPGKPAATFRRGGARKSADLGMTDTTTVRTLIPVVRAYPGKDVRIRILWRSALGRV